MRRQGISLQYVRRVIEHLRARGYDAPLRELRFAIYGGEVFFQHPDGSWEGGHAPRQIVLPHVVRSRRSRRTSDRRPGARCMPRVEWFADAR
jgi:hypothetical protein